MQVRHHPVLAAAAVTTLLLGASACGHAAGVVTHPGDSSAFPGTGGPRPGSTTAKTPSLTAASRQHADPGSGRRTVTRSSRSGSSLAGAMPAGSYDDTTGTTAPPPKSQQEVLATLPGKPGGGCVSVGDQRDVRSGALAMGNFADARAAFHQSKGAYDAAPSFFYVIPQDRDAQRVVLTLTPLSGHGKPIRVVSGQVEEAAQWKYFPISVKIPSAGTWRFTVTVGDQHGCFEAIFRD